MKRMSEQETAEAFGEFAQKAENIVKPKIAKAKGCFFLHRRRFRCFFGFNDFSAANRDHGKSHWVGDSDIRFVYCCRHIFAL